MQLSHHQEENFPALEPHHHGLTDDAGTLFEEQQPSAHRVEDHFYGKADSDLLAFEQLGLTKTLSFNDCDDARLANDIYEEQDNLCERQYVSSHDRNSSDETVTESHLEDVSNLSFSIHNDIDFFLSGNHKPQQLTDLSDLFFRKSPISSPDSSAIESSMLDERVSIEECTENESEWPTVNFHPAFDNASMEPSSFEGEIEEGTEKLPLISREGLRHGQKSRRGGYQQNRIRKSGHQVEYLKRVYEKSGGKLDRKQRKQATKVTGLSWIQIYKWIFDMQTKDNERQSASLPFTTAASPYQIFRVIGKDGNEIGKPMPIFKIEKVVHCQSSSQ